LQKEQIEKLCQINIQKLYRKMKTSLEMIFLSIKKLILWWNLFILDLFLDKHLLMN